MRVKWRKTAYTPADAEEEACQTPPASHSVSAAMGVVGVAYAPGVIASCFRFLEPQEVPGGGGGHGGMSNDDTEDPARAPGVQTAGAAGGGLGLKEALVNKRLDAAFSLGFLHLAGIPSCQGSNWVFVPLRHSLWNPTTWLSACLGGSSFCCPGQTCS